MSAARLVVGLAVVGVAAIVGGMGWLAGPGWAAIAFGVAAVVAAGLLYEPKTGVKRQ